MDLELEFFGGDFEGCYSTHDLGVKKRDVIFECVDRFGVDPENVVFVGNSNGDVREARAAGVKSVFVDRREFDFGKVCPDYKIEHLYELLRI
jgi:FMN phosphatase YigB (HAD superfamily)